MTDNTHPITPPPELIEDWIEIAKPLPQRPPNPNELATQAARWGADQELEACCADLRMVLGPNQADWLRSVRRPKPPSLKEQALEEVGVFEGMGTCNIDIIRRALESLPD